MRTLTTLTHKNERTINKLIREKKTSSFVLLYHSEWDKSSNAIVSRAEKWAEEEGDQDCYIVSSWELPHVFAAFGITTAPCVVEVNNGDVKVFVEYPKVYEYFSTEAELAAEV